MLQQDNNFKKVTNKLSRYNEKNILFLKQSSLYDKQ